MVEFVTKEVAVQRMRDGAERVCIEMRRGCKELIKQSFAQAGLSVDVTVEPSLEIRPDNSMYVIRQKTV